MPLTAGLKFVIHFIVVMLLLYCSAIVFAVLEEPDVVLGVHHNTFTTNTTTTIISDTNLTTTIVGDTNSTGSNANITTHTDLSIGYTNNNNSSSSNSDNNKKINYNSNSNDNKNNNNNNNSVTTPHSDDLQERIDVLWSRLSSRFNGSAEMRKDFDSEVRRVFEGVTRKEHNKHSDQHHDNEPALRTKEFIFMKWFHFVTIATTTIGYGHVHPKTDGGKLFYLFFSIIGITLMMTLLRSCGAIINAINKRLYTLFRFYVLGNKKILSDEMMAISSSTLMFIGFMSLVVWHDTHVEKEKGRPELNSPLEDFWVYPCRLH